jgi:tight adherence protein B
VQVGILLAVAVLATLRVLPAWYAVAFAVALAPAIWLENEWKKRVAKLEEQANSFALALSNTLKATPNVGAALQTVSSLLEGPVAQEFQVASKEARLGRQMDEALRELGQRCGSTKLNTVLAAILIGRQVGGNLPRILETTAATLRELERLEGVLRQKTSDARMQMWGLTLAPFVMCWGIHKLDPTFFQPLMETQTGHILVGVAMACYVASLVAARKIMQVDI